MREGAMSTHIRQTLLAVICLGLAVFTGSRAGSETAGPAAQSTSPSPATPAGTETTQGKGTQTTQGKGTETTQGKGTETTRGTGCDTIQKPASAGGASVVQATGESLQHKNWQPIGGEVQFTVKSFVAIPSDASVLVCFRWKNEGNTGKFNSTRPSR